MSKQLLRGLAGAAIELSAGDLDTKQMMLC